MALFWAKGFATTSMADLEAHLGLGRVSLYGAFGGKKQLFLKCLEKYRRDVTAPLLQKLDAKNGLAGIRDFFDAVLTSPPAVRRRGCLIVNTLVAATEPDPTVDAIIGEHVRHVETRFVRAIRRGQAVGTIASHVRPRGSARLLVTVAHGTFALNRCGIAPDVTKAAIRTALDGLIA